DLEVALLVANDDHVGAERDLTTPDACTVWPRRERVRRIRVEALFHPIPALLDLLAREAEGLGDVAELVRAELAEVGGSDRSELRRHVFADLGERDYLSEATLPCVS